MKKKVLSLMLVLVMLLGLLSACGDSSGDNTGSPAPGGNSGTPGGTGSGEGGMAQITIMVPSYYGGELTKDGSDQVIKAYEDFTNTQVTWDFKPNDTYGDTFGLALMDRKNMPMVLTATGEISGTVIEAAKQGAFWDLTPYLSEYPNLSQIDKNVLSSLTVNGMIVGIPKNREIGRYGLSYRTDWAEAVGITKTPTTIDEVYDMMYKFTYNDPDGNGVQDTYGMEMTKYTGPWDIIQTWFGVGNGWVEKGGDLVPVHETDEYKQALDWMRKIYADGLVRSDWATVQPSEWGQGTQSGKAGMYIDTMDGGRRIWDYFVNNNVASVTDSSALAGMTLAGPVAGKSLATSGYNGYFLITKDGAKTEADLRNCLNFLDKMNSVEMRALADFGVKGLSYDLDDQGGAVMKEGLEIANYPQQGLNQAVAYQPAQVDGALQVTQNERQVAQADAYARCRTVAVFNPAASYLTNSPAYAANQTILKQTIDDARTQYICGVIDWTQFQAQVATWESQGGAQVKIEVNNQYHAG